MADYLIQTDDPKAVRVSARNAKEAAEIVGLDDGEYPIYRVASEAVIVVATETVRKVDVK